MPDLLDWRIENDPDFRKSRLPSLYSDLTVQKSTNPEGYAANVLTWQSALIRAAEAGKLSSDSRLTLCSSESLLNALASPQYGRPSGLGLVLDESVKNGKMLDVKEFRNAEQSIYHRSWVPSPWTVLKWGLRQVGLAGSASYDKTGRLQPGELVLVPAMEDLYKQVQTAQTKTGANLTDRVMTREAFSNTFGRLDDTLLSQRDIELLLRYLERDKGLLSYDSKTVKFKAHTAEMPESITNEDTTIANLKALISSFESQIVNLNARIATMQKNAKSAVEAKNKPAALSALRSKKLAEGALQQRTDTLAQLEEVYTRIEQAVDQVQIVEVMQSSASVLKGLNKKIGGVERVEDVVEELREEMGKVDEVGQVLQEPLDGKMVLDEAEVDDEFEELEREEKRKEEEHEAEQTRNRLAELEEAQKQKQKQKQEQEQVRAAKQVDDDTQLRNSIEQLDRMKISEDGGIDASAKAQRERIPEQAS